MASPVVANDYCVYSTSQPSGPFHSIIQYLLLLFIYSLLLLVFHWLMMTIPVCQFNWPNSIKYSMMIFRWPMIIIQAHSMASVANYSNSMTQWPIYCWLLLLFQYSIVINDWLFNYSVFIIHWYSQYSQWLAQDWLLFHWFVIPSIIYSIPFPIVIHCWYWLLFPLTDDWLVIYYCDDYSSVCVFQAHHCYWLFGIPINCYSIYCYYLLLLLFPFSVIYSHWLLFQLFQFIPVLLIPSMIIPLFIVLIFILLLIYYLLLMMTDWPIFSDQFNDYCVWLIIQLLCGPLAIIDWPFIIPLFNDSIIHCWPIVVHCYWWWWLFVDLLFIYCWFIVIPIHCYCWYSQFNDNVWLTIVANVCIQWPSNGQWPMTMANYYSVIVIQYSIVIHYSNEASGQLFNYSIDQLALFHSHSLFHWWLFQFIGIIHCVDPVIFSDYSMTQCGIQFSPNSQIVGGQWLTDSNYSIDSMTIIQPSIQPSYDYSIIQFNSIIQYWWYSNYSMIQLLLLAMILIIQLLTIIIIIQFIDIDYSLTLIVIPVLIIVIPIQWWFSGHSHFIVDSIIHCDYSNCVIVIVITIDCYSSVIDYSNYIHWLLIDWLFPLLIVIPFPIHWFNYSIHYSIIPFNYSSLLLIVIPII